ncbi:hypothetical protein HELRODRAFT_175580 [Helobdella robusta]|uniref:Uncharacterized protein n=1 Tax=Helobdella robusta TaxID=6412 RepID=T1F9E3_HELRO|nr:hypothetical protein HELRODRAFT_175580 [Helobdella robusta]ESO00608.1 hypothetical protein HELRODRAFT_175580 [Helobdella robusta]
MNERNKKPSNEAFLNNEIVTHNNNNSSNNNNKNSSNNNTYNHNNSPIKISTKEDSLLDELSNKLKKLETLLGVKYEEVHFLKNEVTRLRAVEASHLTYRVDDNKEILNLKQENENLTKELTKCRDEIQILSDRLSQQKNMELLQEYDLMKEKNVEMVGEIKVLESKNIQLLQECEATNAMNSELSDKIGKLESILDDLRSEGSRLVAAVNSQQTELNHFRETVRKVTANLLNYKSKNGNDVTADDVDVDCFSSLEAVVESICREIESLRDEKCIYNKEFEAFTETCLKIMNDVETRGPTCLQLEKSKSKFENERDLILENFGSVVTFNSLAAISKLFDFCVGWQSEIETALLNGSSGVIFESKDGLMSYIQNINDELTSKRQQVSTLERNIERAKAHCESDIQHYQNKIGALESEMDDERKKYLDVLEEMNTLKVGSGEEIKNLLKEIEDLKESQRSMLETNEETIREMKENHEGIIDNQKQEIQTLAERLKESRDDHETSTLTFELTLKEYKDQVIQHSVTICSMEEKQRQLEDELKSLAAEKTVLQNFLDVMKMKQSSDVQESLEENAKLQLQLQKLKKENLKYAKRVDDFEVVIGDLKTELNSAYIRLTDSSGFLSEEQKQIMEEHSRIIENQKEQLRAAEKQLKTAEEQLEISKSSEKQLQEEVQVLSEKICSHEREMATNEKILRKVEKKMDLIENIKNGGDDDVIQLSTTLPLRSSQKQLAILDRSLSPTKLAGLNSQGHICSREQHELVIKRQQNALVQLRAKLKALECGDNPLLSKDEALQQVAYLRRELEELRSVHLAKVKVDNLFDGSYVMNADDVRASHLFAMKELSDLIEISEDAYLELQRSIANILNYDNSFPSVSILQIPRENLNNLIQTRKIICNDFVDRIIRLKEIILDKNHQLNGYDQDLCRLREICPNKEA